MFFFLNYMVLGIEFLWTFFFLSLRLKPFASNFKETNHKVFLN